MNYRGVIKEGIGRRLGVAWLAGFFSGGKVFAKTIDLVASFEFVQINKLLITRGQRLAWLGIWENA